MVKDWLAIQGCTDGLVPRFERAFTDFVTQNLNIARKKIQLLIQSNSVGPYFLCKQCLFYILMDWQAA